MVVVLNESYGGDLPAPRLRGYNEAQHNCVMGLRAAVHALVSAGKFLTPLPELRVKLKEGRLDYAGEPMCLMEELIAEKVLPCWPKPGEAAVQKAEHFVPEGMKELLHQPRLLLLPEDQWPDSPPPAKVRATQEEWVKICRAGVERNMMVGLRIEEVFHDHRGRPVFNGAMAVPKYKKVGDREVRLQRFISNLVPANSSETSSARRRCSSPLFGPVGHVQSRSHGGATH